MTAQEAWEAALGELQLQVNKANFNSWLKPTRGLSYTDNTFLIGVPNPFIAEWLEKRWHSLIKKTLISVLGSDLEIKFQVGATGPQLPQPPAPAAAPRPDAARPASNAANVHPSLIPKYTFSNFVVSSSNCLAHAAALDVAQNPARNYNPLFIYAGSGLGKTHLLQAIGHTVWAAGYKVLCSNGEQFTNEFVNSLRSHTLEDFRMKYRTPDVLLMDDIQFFCGKEQMQENFFYAFNDLYNASRQIVLCSDRPPKSLPFLEDRLISRFEWGIMVGILPPDQKGRFSILKSKAANLSLPFPDDALLALARAPFHNIRELEGSLNKVSAVARLSNQPPTTELVDSVIREMFPPERQTGTPAAEKVVDHVARHYNVTAQSILNKKGGRASSLIRYVALYLLREQSGLSLSAIGAFLGYKDHTSVAYGYKKIASSLDKDKDLKDAIEKISRDLRDPVLNQQPE
ncbi:MAG: chromosomal replication initiator protein DnaA [Chloroflexi bacterium]|nr:chromosomal replication initiator protein DnaA [Chloroflexota bacterium]